MNNLLQLKGSYNQRSHKGKPGAPSLPNNSEVKVEHLKKLLIDLNELSDFWSKEELLEGALVSVRYKTVIAKSRRISGFLSKGSSSPNNTVVGAKFDNTYSLSPKHIITHYVGKGLIDESIHRLNVTIAIVEDLFGNEISSTDLEKISKNDLNIGKYEIAKTNFLNIIVDSYYVETFMTLENDLKSDEPLLVTIYKTGEDSKKVLEKLGITVSKRNTIDNNTFYIKDEDILKFNKHTYLISMNVKDFSEIEDEIISLEINDNNLRIDSPSNEPIVGVIDTLFDEEVYFNEWVEYENLLDPEIPVDFKDRFHGTSVTSIIVDGPQIDPRLDDGCGRFRVKHFGVAAGRKFSSLSIIKHIETIITANKDIKVWNLSLGSNSEINKNFISIEASILDKIQYENDVIFIIAGTNNNSDSPKRIGAPADSINSIIVNAVDFNQHPVPYSRKGIVLSFFNKPDISFYGGTEPEKLVVFGPNGERKVKGTSYAAPWITRKVAYLIYVMGLSREVAKALIVDSATSWNLDNEETDASLVGFGTVPIRIENIINSGDDEIKFVLSGVSEKYDTYNYNLPVPIVDNKYPFIAKATMCYFPKCSRNQGVDYTNTELDIGFGRIDDDGKVKTINNNNQSAEGSHLYEGNARKLFRKWDNVKHIREIIKSRLQSKKAYSSKMWGISIKTKERLEQRTGIGIRFGVVITLKEIYGINRIEDFIHQCSLKGWLVNQLEIENRIDIYNKAEEEVEFD